MVQGDNHLQYRVYQDTDLKEVMRLCAENGIEFDPKVPQIGFVAVRDEGGLAGFILAFNAVLVEPFVCENENSAVKLYNMMEGALAFGKAKIVLAHISTQKKQLQKEAPKLGYVKIEGHDIYKKVL